MTACVPRAAILGPDTNWCENCRNPLSEAEHRDNSHECPAFFRDSSAPVQAGGSPTVGALLIGRRLWLVPRLLRSAQMRDTVVELLHMDPATVGSARLNLGGFCCKIQPSHYSIASGWSDNDRPRPTICDRLSARRAGSDWLGPDPQFPGRSNRAGVSWQQ
jgi:hypothetical protein